jgi:DnaJ-domain-containing protein 1
VLTANYPFGLIVPCQQAYARDQRMNVFERNPIDNRNAMAIAVEITLDDGTLLHGRTALDKGRSVHQLMSGEDSFLYVERADGDADFIPKASIKGLKIVRPVIPQPLRQPSSSGQFDPARVLGVATDATWDEIRAAYHQAVKLYHPDRFAGIDLPPEVASYIDAKAKQINQAFRMLKAARSGAIA